MGLGQGSGPFPAEALSPITLSLEAQEPGILTCVTDTFLVASGPQFPCLHSGGRLICVSGSVSRRAAQDRWGGQETRATRA